VDVDPRPSVLGLVSGSAFNLVYEMIEWLLFIGLIVFGVLHHISKQIEAADKRAVDRLERIITLLEKQI
jgi:hypothetical protein